MAIFVYKPKDMNRLIKEQAFCNIADLARKGRLESVTYFTDCTMSKTGNPFYGRVQKLVKATGLQFGVSYSNISNGGFNPIFAPKLKGCMWVKYPVIIRSLAKDADKYGKLQMRCTLTSTTKFSTTYFVDGRLATNSEIRTIEKFVRDSKSTIFNITIEKIVEWRVDGQTFTDNDLNDEIVSMAM